MKIIKINAWSPINGVNHVSTDWRIGSSSSDVDNILNISTSAANLNVLYTDKEPPAGSVYYVSYRRNLDDGTVKPWSAQEPYEASTDDSGLMLETEVKVGTPIVYVDSEKIKNNSSSVEITTSPYSGVGDSHFSTHYFIIDPLDNVIYASLDNTTDKTSKVIDAQALGLTDYPTLKIVAIHKTGSGIESAPGEVTINIGDSNILVATNLRRVLPYEDLVITFNKIDNTIPNTIELGKLTDVATGKVIGTIKDFGNDDLSWDKSSVWTTNSCTIPGEYLSSNTEYYFDIYVDDYKDIYSKRFMITVLSSRQDNMLDRNYKYKGTYKEIYNGPYTETNNTINHNINTNQMHNGHFIIPEYDSSNNTIFKYGELVIKNSKPELNIVGDITGIGGVSIGNIEDVYIKFTKYNKLVVFSRDGSNLNVLIYNYSPVTKIYTRITYANFSSPVDENFIKGHGIVNVEDGAYFLLSDSMELWHVSNTGSFTQIDTDSQGKLLEIPGYNKGTMLDLYNGDALMFGGDSAYLYTFKSRWFRKATEVPVDFRNCQLKPVPLVNGDYIIFNTEATSTTKNKFMKYNSKTKKLTIPKNQGNAEYQPGCITMLNGDVYTIKVTTNHYIINKYS